MKKGRPLQFTLEELIAQLPDNPEDVIAPKKISVRDAIISLRDKVGSKVFTKRNLKDLIEAAYPELIPVAMPNLDASMSRAKDYFECFEAKPQNIYRFKPTKL